MCIQINTQFINLLVIKKNVNLYIGRKQSHVMMTEWLMFFPISKKNGFKCTKSTEKQWQFFKLQLTDNNNHPACRHLHKMSGYFLLLICIEAVIKSRQTEWLRGFKVIYSCCVITASSYRHQELNLEASPQQMTLMCKFKTKKMRRRRRQPKHMTLPASDKFRQRDNGDTVSRSNENILKRLWL